MTVPSSTKTGFSLVETMVVVGILGMLATIGITYLTNMSGKEELNSATSEIVSALKNARSVALTQQRPVGYAAGTTINVVSADLRRTSNTVVSAYPNGDSGNTYFSNVIDEDLTIIVPDTIVRFKAFDGNLATDVVGTPLAVGQTIAIEVSLQGSTDKRIVVINYDGKIDD